MVPKVVSFLIILGSIQLISVTAFSLTIEPEYARVNPDPQNVTFTCFAGEPISGCQFRWLDNYGSAGPLLELSRGPESEAHSAHLSEEITDYTYHGQGLAKGECGVTMQVRGDKRWMVACRVHAAAKSGGWRYSWADLHSRNKSLLETTMSAKEVVLLPGNELKIVAKSQGSSLSRCNFFLPGVPRKIGFKEGVPSESSSDLSYGYQGEGLKNGDCGIALPNVTEENNGQALFWISSSTTNSDYSRFVAVVVARPPSAPAMQVVYDGNHVTATCVVRGSRPAATITWHLGDAYIRQDSVDDSLTDVQDEWRWPWMQVSTMQKISLKLQPAQDGLTLKCKVSHVSMTEALEASQTVFYNDPSKPTVAQCRGYNAEIMELLLKEAKSRAANSELAEESAKTALEIAKVSLKASEARAQAVEADAKKAVLAIEAATAHARAQETKATNAEEELAFERERRSKGVTKDHSGRPVRWQSMVRQNTEASVGVKSKIAEEVSTTDESKSSTVAKDKSSVVAGETVSSTVAA